MRVIFFTMALISSPCSFVVLLLSRVAIAWSNSSSPSPTSLTFPTPSGYITTLYNVSAATTTLAYNYTNEELAVLWDQIGPISTGPITTTVSPTPEPSAYPRPRAFHPQVSANQLRLNTTLIALGPYLRHISQLRQATR